MSSKNENRSCHSLKQAVRDMAIFALFEILSVVVLFYLVSSSLIDVDQFLWSIIIVQGCVFVFIIVSIFGSVFKKKIGLQKKLSLIIIQKLKALFWDFDTAFILIHLSNIGDTSGYRKRRDWCTSQVSSVSKSTRSHCGFYRLYRSITFFSFEFNNILQRI